MKEPPRYYQRNLPHMQPEGKAFSVVYCLNGSLPKTKIHQLKAERDKTLDEINQKRAKYLSLFPEGIPALFKEELWEAEREARNIYFGKFNHLLDNPTSGPTWLSLPEIATIVKDSLHYLEQDRKVCRLIAYCIMSNHVHLILSELSIVLHIFLKLHKQYTARQANLLLKRTGNPFWQKESYDHIIRDYEFDHQIAYTLNNPVKAGLVSDWADWPHSYLADM